MIIDNHYMAVPFLGVVQDQLTAEDSTHHARKQMKSFSNYSCSVTKWIT